MRIKFIQNLIDKLRFKEKFATTFQIYPKLNSFQKKIIKEIKDFQKKCIEFPDNTEKELLEGCFVRYGSHDPLGVILKKDDKIYRGIYTKSCDYFKELYKTGILQTLSKYGYIPKFRITNYYTDEYPIILEVEKVHIVNSTFWTYSQIKAEAVMKIELIEILNEFGYSLIDGHTCNSTFVNNKPIFFDFGSFIKKKDNYAVKELIINNIVTLILMSLKNCYWSKQLLISSINHGTLPAVDYLNSNEVKSAIRKFTNLKNHNIIKNIFKKGIVKKEYIEKLFKVKDYISNTPWSNYNNTDNFKELKNERFLNIIECINKYSPNAESLLDLAGNSGLFCTYARKYTNIKNITNTDYDMIALEKFFEKAKENNIEMYCLNPLHPTISAKTIFNADVVCALAVTHHLLLTQGFNIDSMFYRFKEYTKEYVYIEFCPLGMYSEDNPNFLPQVPEWYTTEWFEAHFKKFFKLIDKKTVSKVTVNNKEYNHRILFVGKII